MPVGRAGIAYSPPSVVIVFCATLVATFVAVTVAPGITAPELSVTVPVSTPRSDWGKAAAEKRSSTIAARANGCVSAMGVSFRA